MFAQMKLTGQYHVRGAIAAAPTGSVKRIPEITVGDRRRHAGRTHLTQVANLKVRPPHRWRRRRSRLCYY